MRGFWLLFAALMISSSVAHGRVFDFKNENFAIFFGIGIGNSFLGDGAYALASGAPGVSFSKKDSTSRAAEVGLAYTLKRINLRLGADYYMPADRNGVIGRNAAGVELFSIDSRVHAYSWTGNLELIFFSRPQSRGMIGAGYGMATANLSNHYLVTTDGTAAYGVGSYREEGQGTGTMFQGYLAWEALISDVSTAVLQLGYRDLHISGFKSNKSTTAISGTQTNGGSIRNMDGSDRAVNLGGLFFGINFRFYL